MSPEGQKTCVVLGAGALGLGFLGPELGGDYRMLYADIPQKGKFLDYLHLEHRYTFNETGPSIRTMEVCGVDGVEVGSAALREALGGAELVFTAVGEPNLAAAAPMLADVLSERSADRPLRVLCCENGVEIAGKLTACIERELSEPVGDRARVCDTVMGRMCKMVSPVAPPLEPVAGPFDWAVAGEPFFGMPVEAHALEGLEVPAALQPVSPPIFSALEDVKMLAHNGLHAFLAFLGHMAGKELFCELRDNARVMTMAGDLLRGEVGQALFSKHGPALDRNFYMNYAPTILRRITCPGLRDSVARGIRGAMRKLEPDERLIYSLRTIAAQGITPELYATAVAAAITVARASGETELSFREVLTHHCMLDEKSESGLIALIESKQQFLETWPLES